MENTRKALTVSHEQVARQLLFMLGQYQIQHPHAGKDECAKFVAGFLDTRYTRPNEATG